MASCIGERRPESVLLVGPSVSDEELAYVRSLNPGSELWTSADGSQRLLKFYAPRKLGTSIAQGLANPFIAVFKGTAYLVGYALIGALGQTSDTH